MKYFKQYALMAAMVAGVAMSSNAAASNAYEGYQLYNTYCIFCHGADGKGDGPLANKLGKKKPANLTDASRMRKRTDKDLFQIIQGTADHAKINGKMPRWGLAIPGPQINSLVSYVRMLHDSKEDVIGNPEAGRKIYENTCSACHGVNGKGDGIMTNVLPMEPADHTDAAKMAKLSNSKLLNVITNGTRGPKSFMPGYKGSLSRDEINSLVGYIRLLSY
ncbi:c-type cytochrome [Sedimenticola sp.]|uniref:c-type cytochrome n=1 Tax=Sedimenticola sp. TaxID=1940285 RepID=UPI003D1192EA